MKVVVTSDGAGIDAAASPVFGRCRSYVFVDTESMDAETVENPAMNAAGGAGIQAAQFVVEQGAEAVISGNVGPNAYNVLLAADVPVHLLEDGTVRDAVEAFKNNQLQRAGGATGPAHAGMGRGAGRRGGTSVRRPSVSSSGATQPEAASTHLQQDQVSQLTETAAELRKKLAEVMDRLDQLEEQG